MRWREGKGKKKGGPPVGTTFDITLNEAARVTLSFAKQAPGRRAGKKCVAPTKANAKHSPCSRLLPAGTQTLAAKAGSTSIPFSGRIGGKKLAPGAYTVTITATNASGQVTSAKPLTFTIVAD